MNRLSVSISVLIICWISLPGRAGAQAIRINGGNPLISITTGAAGGQPTPVVNTACSIRYKRQAAVSRITVSATCPGQRFSLKVLAVNPTGGVAAPEVTLINGMPAVNFITNIPTGNPPNRTCTLRYTASATFDQGNSTELGNDVYTVVYTILAP